MPIHLLLTYFQQAMRIYRNRQQRCFVFGLDHSLHVSRPKSRTVAAFIVLLACFVVPLDAAEKSPYVFDQVPNHQPIKPGEHPRLLFRKSDLPEIKRRAATPLGQKIVARLKATLGGGEAMPEHFNPKRIPYQGDPNLPEGAFTISHAAGFGMLYQLTGEQKYADLGRQCLELGLAGQRDRDSRYSMRYAGEELRLGPSLAWTALGYDLLYDGLDPEFRKKIALFIQNYNEDAHDGRPKHIKAYEKTGKWPKLDIETQAMKPRYHRGQTISVRSLVAMVWRCWASMAIQAPTPPNLMNISSA